MNNFDLNFKGTIHEDLNPDNTIIFVLPSPNLRIIKSQCLNIRVSSDNYIKVDFKKADLVAVSQEALADHKVINIDNLSLDIEYIVINQWDLTNQIQLQNIPITIKKIFINLIVSFNDEIGFPIVTHEQPFLKDFIQSKIKIPFGCEVLYSEKRYNWVNLKKDTEYKAYLLV